MKIKLFFLFVFIAFALVSLVSAKVNINIQGITLEEPSDGIINDKDHIAIKATIGNLGDTNLDSPYSLDTYVNDKRHTSCSGSCELSGNPVNQGLKAGQTVESYWASSATDREYLKLGENEVKFYLNFETQTEPIEKSIKFNITEGGLPELDLEIISSQINLVDLDGEKKIESVNAEIKNNGPVILQNDVISVSFCISSEDGESNLGCYGSFIDLRDGFCKPSIENCKLAPGDSIQYSQTENLERLNARLNTGKYVINYFIDDINGLKNYQDSNKNNNYLYSNFEITGSSENQTTLVHDEISGIDMEQGVKYRLDSRLYRKMNICTNCGDLPKPKISLEGGNKPAGYNLYFNDKKVRGFILPSLEVEKEIIDNPENVLIGSDQISVNGTNSIEFLINSQGNFFQATYDVLTPNQETNVNYQIVKKESRYGSIYFFMREGDTIFNIDELSQKLDEIAYNDSHLAGMSSVPKYYVLIMPYLFAGLMGGEGKFYMGDGVISINYGGEKTYELMRDQHNTNIITSGFSHEYVHLLQSQPETKQYAISDNTGFFMEGMADGVSIFNGYRQWSEVIEDPIEQGCSQLVNQHVPHTLGRCIFKHLDQDGFLNSAFFNRLFHLSGESYLLSTCDANFSDVFCISELNRILSYSTNQDMTMFMENSLLANMSGMDVEQLRTFATQTENSCPLIGLRKEGVYCSPEKIWTAQKEADSICDNNFECSTNLCIDGKCISSGLWQKFLSWIKNFLG